MQIILPDTHGRNWFAYKLGDHPIFLGDYVDSFDIPPEQQMEQLQNIISYKLAFPRTTLLLGNHDVQYLHYPQYRCSGFQSSWSFKFQQVFHQNRHLFQFMTTVGDYHISHAGVSQTWFIMMREKYGIQIEDLEDFLNAEPKEIYWCGSDNNGNDPCSGPLWARELWKDDLGIKQIVGHTYGQVIISPNVHVIDVEKPTQLWL